MKPSVLQQRIVDSLLRWELIRREAKVYLVALIDQSRQILTLGTRNRTTQLMLVEQLIVHHWSLGINIITNHRQELIELSQRTHLSLLALEYPGYITVIGKQTLADGFVENHFLVFHQIIDFVDCHLVRLVNQNLAQYVLVLFNMIEMGHQLICISETYEDDGILALLTQQTSFFQKLLARGEYQLDVSIGVSHRHLVCSFGKHLIFEISGSSFWK